MTTLNAERFWNRIRKLIKDGGYTQRQFADFCGIPLNTLRGWMSKGILPPLEDAYIMSGKLSVSIDEFVLGKRDLPSRFEGLMALFTAAGGKLDRINRALARV
jgi:transcriptional regulator with XRE-family HTH domain